MSVVDRLGWSVLGSGLFLVLAAFFSDRTGTHVAVGLKGDHVINTHTPATLVLASLGIVLVVNGFVLLSVRGDAPPEDPQDS